MVHLEGFPHKGINDKLFGDSINKCPKKGDWDTIWDDFLLTCNCYMCFDTKSDLRNCCIQASQLGNRNWVCVSHPTVDMSRMTEQVMPGYKSACHSLCGFLWAINTSLHIYKVCGGILLKSEDLHFVHIHRTKKPVTGAGALNTQLVFSSQGSSHIPSLQPFINPNVSQRFHDLLCQSPMIW